MAKKIAKQSSGGWLDPTLDRRALKIIRELTPDANLPREIGELVGKYRADAQDAKSSPTPTASIRHAKKVSRAISAILSDLEVMPADVKGLATDGLRALSGEHYEPFTDRIAIDLMKYRAALSHAVEKMQDWPVQRGDKSGQREHRLLSDVSALLEATLCKEKKTYLAGMAAEILTYSCGHKWPAKADKAREAISTYRKKHPLD